MTESRVLDMPDGPWARPSGGPALTALLAEYEDILVAAGVPVRDSLAPGLSPEEIIAKLLAVHLRPNEEIIAWFGWQNGLTEPAVGRTHWNILPDLIPESVDELTDNYRIRIFDNVPTTEYMGNVMDPRFTSNGLGFGWLPLEFGNIPRYAVYCLGEPDAIPLVRTAQPEHFDPAWARKLQAVSLCTPVTWWIEGIASGAHVWDPEEQGWKDPDYTKIPATQAAAGF